MIIGITGKMGSGKTLTMSVLALYLRLNSGKKIYSNYNLLEANIIKKQKDLWKIEDGIICFDEIWINLDSRLWKNNVFLTRWILQTRKKNIILLYTAQHIDQVEKRLRLATDYLIHCFKKNKEERNIYIIDYQYNELIKKLKLTLDENTKKILSKIYNTYETIKFLE